jgi:hypothetical protein
VPFASPHPNFVLLDSVHSFLPSDCFGGDDVPAGSVRALGVGRHNITRSVTGSTVHLHILCMDKQTGGWELRRVPAFHPYSEPSLRVLKWDADMAAANERPAEIRRSASAPRRAATGTTATKVVSRAAPLRPPRASGPVVTDRDMSILQWIGRHGIVTPTQVATHFFLRDDGTAGTWAAYRRLRILEQLGLLQRDRTFWRESSVLR